MTRKSKSEIERTVDDLTAADEVDDDAVVYEDAETGEWYETPDMTGEPLDRCAVDPVMVLEWDESAAEAAWTPQGSHR